MQVCAEGFDAGKGASSGHAGHARLDASLLILPMVGFLPPDDPRVRGTVPRWARTAGGRFLLRYTRRDGLPGREGAFLACTFWLVDAYVLMRMTTRRLPRAAAGARNGSASCRVEPVAGQLVGNFPRRSRTSRS